MAEIRLDKCNLKINDVAELFKSHKKLIATFRKTDLVSEKKRKKQLLKAIISGAAYIDLDYFDDSKIMDELKEAAKKNSAGLIISYHDIEKTPPNEFIHEIISKMIELKPDLIKLAFKSNSVEDDLRVLSLYDRYENLLAFNMGEKGKITRAASLKLGAPFAYVCKEGSPTAEGQMTVNKMKLYSQKAII